jgi:hypothetical protein
MAARDGFTLDPGVSGVLLKHLDRLGRGPSFGNARLIRNLLDATGARQAQRVTSGRRPTNADIRTLRPEDLPDSPGQSEERLGLYL